MLPLNKLYDPVDLSDPVMKHWVSELQSTEAILEQDGLKPVLPTIARYWEYAQALRACWIRMQTASPIKLLEVGGSDSIFLPTAMRTKSADEYTSVELPAWTHEHSERRRRQCPSLVRQLTELPDEEFDFVACISVVEHI